MLNIFLLLSFQIKLLLLKVLPATRFEGQIESGGSTMPWKVYLLDDGKEVPYIVKLFSNRTTEQQFPVAKEIICSVLANEFGLYTPDYALADFSELFINQILGDKERQILATKHQGLKFASKYQEGMSVFSINQHRKLLRNYDFANIFAFDCLIYHLDRGFKPDKPNLLVEDDNYLLIDHELSFPFIDNNEGFYNKIVADFNQGRLDYSYGKHLLYPIISNYHSNFKIDAFHEFEEYLCKIDIQKIRDAIYALSELDILSGYYQRLIDYLCMLKENSNSFCRILLASIA